MESKRNRSTSDPDTRFKRSGDEGNAFQINGEAECARGKPRQVPGKEKNPVEKPKGNAFRINGEADESQE